MGGNRKRMSDGGKGDKRRPEDAEAFSEGYEKVFGNSKPTRGRFIWDSELKKFIHFDEYVRPASDAPMIMPDIQPYQSMVTGEYITSRSKHRSHLKQHGLIEVGNEVQKPQEKKLPPGLKETIARQVYEKLKY